MSRPAPGTCSDHAATVLDEGWRIQSTAPGAWRGPDDVPESDDWSRACVPGTVAMSVGPSGVDGHRDYDADDWWYRCSFHADASTEGDRVRLRFGGLAVLAEVWLNGEKILESDNMFLMHVVDISDHLRDENDLLIVFRSLGSALLERRPRPRWKTRLVAHQSLRWFRTTLLGRIPGWTPAVPAVGPWRPVWLERTRVLRDVRVDLNPTLVEGAGHISARVVLDCAEGTSVIGVTLDVAGTSLPLEVESASSGVVVVVGDGALPGTEAWWPHTHGPQNLYAARVFVETDAGSVEVDCGRIGFRTVSIDQEAGAIRYHINGVPVFCRGSCWSSNDIVSLTGPEEALRRSLELAVDAGANMLRVGGTMVYETDRFYELCDELGVMVWQDFMFANMDYPADDPDFLASVRAEADGLLGRLQRRASVVTYCGNSEIEQQAAMFGAAPDIWSNELFRGILPQAVADRHPGVPYWPSTPTGGALPFHVGEGLAHYFGVGAYLRPLEDVRVANVRFSPECLGFSNVPEPSSLQAAWPDGAPPTHHPDWKSGVPRDTGAGWDFEDVRDYYLEQLYQVDAVRLRGENPERYLALSRVVTGEVMARVYDEWRAGACGGGLTWFYRDLRPGAGWGIVDSQNAPKAAFYHVRRAWAPRAVRLFDRGLDGLDVVVFNDRPGALEAELELLVIGRGSVVTASARTPIEVPGHDSIRQSVDRRLGYFTDSTYSYRFGSQQHDVVVARLVQDDALLAEDVFVPDRARSVPPAKIEAAVNASEDGHLVIELSTDVVAYDVRIQVRDHRPLDNHFCLTPGRRRVIPLVPVSESPRAFRGFVDATNVEEGVRLTGPG